MLPKFTVIRDNTPASAIPRGAVVAMGNFDGVHLGHRAVIGAALRMSRTHGNPAFAVTFEPHPRSFFSPNSPQFRLTTETNKLRLLAGTGLAGTVVMTFDKVRAGTSAQDFIHHDLIERLGISGIAVGYDFHFGKGRVGSPGLLVAEAPRLGIEVDVQAASGAPVTVDSVKTTFAAYPFVRRARITTSDAAANSELQKMLDVSWRTLRVDAHETFMDCAYYEQLQYIGDTRLEALTAMTLSGDARLVKNALKTLQDTQSADGLTFSRGPSRPMAARDASTLSQPHTG